MIVNLWSTPRTGSVWYSKFLNETYKGSFLVSEMLNRLHMNLYHVYKDGTFFNYTEPVENGFYREYYLDDRKYLNLKYIYDKRTRTIPQQEQYCWDLLENVNPDQTLILHNHIDPINTDIREWLFQNSKENIWIYRKNKKLQLASYAVAISTKKFATFEPSGLTYEPVEDIDIGPLEMLIRRIQLWESFPKQHVVAFEDIKFFNAHKYPLDQNTDAWSRLSVKMQNCIEDLVMKYENFKN